MRVVEVLTDCELILSFTCSTRPDITEETKFFLDDLARIGEVCVPWLQLVAKCSLFFGARGLVERCK